MGHGRRHSPEGERACDGRGRPDDPDHDVIPLLDFDTEDVRAADLFQRIAKNVGGHVLPESHGVLHHLHAVALGRHTTEPPLLQAIVQDDLGGPDNLNRLLGGLFGGDTAAAEDRELPPDDRPPDARRDAPGSKGS